MKLDLATLSEIRWILIELENAKRRYKSADFLDGFPWESVKWYRADLEYSELENLFLFWDGSAWGESPQKLPRKLKDGVNAFARIESDPRQANKVHLREIKGWLRKYEAGETRNDEPFLILGGIDQNRQLIILDGNHRVSAALWWAIRSGDRTRLPLKAWVGLSPDMIKYGQYRRLFRLIDSFT